MSRPPSLLLSWLQNYRSRRLADPLQFTIAVLVPQVLVVLAEPVVLGEPRLPVLKPLARSLLAPQGVEAGAGTAEGELGITVHDALYTQRWRIAKICGP